MKVSLQAWLFGRLTINHDIENVSCTTTIQDLLINYVNNVITPAHPPITVQYALPKMELCGKNDFIYDKSKSLQDYGITDGSHFTVLAGFSY